MSPNWGLDGPMPWLTAQLLQDPEQSNGLLTSIIAGISGGATDDGSSSAASILDDAT